MFPNMHGGRLSADSVQSLLAKYVQVAREMYVIEVETSVAACVEAQRCDELCRRESIVP